MKIFLLLFFLLYIEMLGVASEDNIFHQAIENAQKRTVKIYGGAIGEEHGYASGIIVSSDGQILTTTGMFLSSKALRVTLSDGKVYTASVLKRDRSKQLALLKVNAETPNFFNFNLSIECKKGDWVLAVANPFKVADGTEELSVNLGVISMKTELAVKRRSQEIDFEGQAILIDAITGNPGSQGGALVGIDGNLIGMIGKVLEDKGTNTRINYAIPIASLAEFLLQSEDVKVKQTAVVYLGIQLFKIGGNKAPAFIDRVDLGSPGFLAGLKKDDLIVSIADKKIFNCGDFDKAVKELEANVKVQVLIKRKEDFYKVDIIPTNLELEVEDDDENK